MATRLKVLLWILGILYAVTVAAVAVYLAAPSRPSEDAAPSSSGAPESPSAAPTNDSLTPAVPPGATAGASLPGAKLPEVGPHPAAASSDSGSSPSIATGTAEGAEFISWLYRKCWDTEGRERHAEACDRLPKLEQRIDDRMATIGSCKKEFSGAGTAGLLDLMIEIDIRTDLVSVWNGVDSTLPFANPTVGCVAKALRHMPLSALAAPFERYQMETTIEFKRPEKQTHEQPVHHATEDLAADLRIAGIPAVVKNDKVRVRKSPVDGEIIGLISAGNTVSIIEQTMKDDAEWCRVLTPRKNIGWMVCWSLERHPGAPEESPVKP